MSHSLLLLAAHCSLTGYDRTRSVEAEVIELPVGPHGVKHGHLPEKSTRNLTGGGGGGGTVSYSSESPP